MKKLKSSLAAKVVAILLLVACAVTVFTGALGISVLAKFGAYTRSFDNIAREFLLDKAMDLTYEVSGIYFQGEDLEQSCYAHMDNFFFTVTEDGKTVFEKPLGEQDGVHFEYQSFRYSATSDQPRPVAEEHIPYTVTGYVRYAPTGDDEIAREYSLLMRGVQYRNVLIGVSAAAFVIGIALFVFLLSAAGHRKDTDEIVPTFLEKIPFDIFFVLCGLLVCLPISAAFSISDGRLPLILLMLALFTFSGLCALMFFMSLAVRLKTGGIIRGCVCYKILAWLGRGLKKLCRFVRDALKAVPLIPKALLITGGVLLVDLIWICATRYDGESLVFGWLISRAALVLLLLYAAKCAKDLSDGAKRLASGDMGATVDTAKMRGVFKTHGDDLNSIREGISRAVDERMKSERFRTELITNVSHDIKTPLTSIVNYVDLLSKEELDNDKAGEYVDVLSRQSAKLKKLIDDLVEASKASTGSLSVKLEKCELGVLLAQCAGEYEDRLKNGSLELIVTKPDEPVTVMADGRHMWRIFDNLMNNITKYALPGTRVYLDLEKDAGTAKVIFRNISRTRLNISADELMERFVRGDSSRNTDGSGLGLSIARSLAQLQNGSLDITVDGDLFKAELRFPLVH